MTQKEKSAVDEYMGRPGLPETLKAANREFIASPDDWAHAIEANAAKAAPLASELAKWQALALSPWEAPGGLLEAAAALERDYPVTLPLALAIDLMAFGNEAVPEDASVSSQLEAGARRRRARQALVDAAGQARFPLEHGPDCLPVKPGQFTFIQGPGSDGGSLEFKEIKEGARLHAVQIVEAGKFFGWLRQLAGHTQRTAKRGPKFKYDWNEGKARFDQLMAQNGDLDDRQDWSANADIEREIMKHMEKHGGGEPPRSSVQAKVSEWLKLFRACAR